MHSYWKRIQQKQYTADGLYEAETSV